MLKQAKARLWEEFEENMQVNAHGIAKLFHTKNEKD